VSDGPPAPEVTPRRAAATLLVAAVALGGWLRLFDRIGVETWGHGEVTFFRLLGVVLLLGAASAVTRRLALGRLALPIAVLCAVAAVGLLVHLGGELRVELERPENRHWLIDIGANTYVAGTHLLEGRNPYAHRAQLWHRVDPGEGVRREGGRLLMHGLPYDYGFPYFPGMMLSYLPFRPLAEGYDAIRVGNFVLVLLNVLGLAWLGRRLAGGRPGLAAGAIGAVAYLGVRVLGQEYLRFGVTDLAIATFCVYAFVALAHDRVVLAGVLFGAAQACKLLPGPALLLPVILQLGWGPTSRRLLVAYALTASAIVLPFVAWDPARFFSSTVLFYLTYHANGDDTALWYFLSPGARPWFLVAGGALTLATLALGRLRRDLGLVWPLTLSFSAYVVFCAFNKMTHLNYLWGVYPLGCAALGVLGVGVGGTVSLGRSRDPSPVSAPPSGSEEGS